MKILVVSDTHGFAEIIEDILQVESNFDLLIHCGDIEGQEDYVKALVDCPCCFVAGNNDWFSNLPREDKLIVDDYSILVTHGHYYGVSLGSERLLEEALDQHVSIALYGHTHKPVVEHHKNVMLMNPGSLAYPRQQGRKKTYGVIYIDSEHQLHAEIRELS